MNKDGEGSITERLKDELGLNENPGELEIYFAIQQWEKTHSQIELRRKLSGGNEAVPEELLDLLARLLPAHVAAEKLKELWAILDEQDETSFD